MKLLLKNPLGRVTVTQGFGNGDTSSTMLTTYTGMGLQGHNGVDMVAFDGIPVYAAHDGRVTFAGYDGSGGLGVVIRTEQPVDFIDKTTSYAKTIYWHLKKGSLKVTASQTVKAGDQIGEADNTGLSTGSHLHFGLKPIARGENDWTWYNTEQDNGYMGAIDPRPYFIPFQQEMKYGETWDDVIKLQKFLGKLGFFHEIPFAKYGPATAKAVLLFQKKYCKLSWYEEFVLKGTRVGPKTLTSLNEQWYNNQA